MRLGLLSDIHGIDTRIGDDRLGGILAGCNADLVIGGHTHDVTDRRIGAVRAVNLGSVSNPTRTDRQATYVVIDAAPTGHVITHRFVDYDHDAFVQRLHDVRHPAAAYIQRFQRARTQGALRAN